MLALLAWCAWSCLLQGSLSATSDWEHGAVADFEAADCRADEDRCDSAQAEHVGLMQAPKPKQSWMQVPGAQLSPQKRGLQPRGPTLAKRLRRRVPFLAAAKEAIAAAQTKAQRLGVSVSIAVVDRFANLAAFQTMDGADIGSIDIAIRKATTSRLFDVPSADLGELSQPGADFYYIEVSNGGLVTFCGGLPLKHRGKIVGAIGVSGAPFVEKDCAIASAGQAAFKQERPTVPRSIGEEQAQSIVDAAFAAANTTDCKALNGGQKCRVNVAVVDAGGKLLKFEKGDGAFIASVDIAIKKAKTAALFCSVGVTEVLGGLSVPGAPLWQIQHSNSGLITIAGGVVIEGKAKNECIGAIGVSGATSVADKFIAEAALVDPPAHAKHEGTGDVAAESALKVATDKAKQMGAAQSIALVDAGGTLVMFTRMDKARLGSADVAVKKANSALRFALNSSVIGQLSDPGQALGDGPENIRQIELSNGGLISFAGGVPVFDTNGTVAFGIGVDGGGVDKDAATAETLKSAFGVPEARARVSLADAETVIEAAIANFTSQNLSGGSFCVVDQFSNVVAFKRLDGGIVGAIDVACEKASTSASFNGLPTSFLNDLAVPAGGAYRIEHSDNYFYTSQTISTNHGSANPKPGGHITFGGGCGLFAGGGELVGALGVSGALPSQDERACLAGAAALP